MRKCASLVAILVTTNLTIAPAMAQNVCLQLNRVLSTKVISNDTLLATDLGHGPYTIHMLRRCVGLDPSSENLSIRRAAEVGSEYLCIQRGDILGYSLPGGPGMELQNVTLHGAQTQMQCTIDSVTRNPPPTTDALLRQWPG